MKADSKQDRLVVVIPGIGGSVLRTSDGSVLWDAVPGAVGRLLRQPDRFSLDHDVTPAGLIRSRVLFPGLTKIHGYERLLRRVHEVVGGPYPIDLGDPGQSNLDARVVAFPYDFRRSVSEAAARLDDEITRRLDHLGWRKEPNKVIIVAHSMGGLVARRWVAQYDAWDTCRGLITLGTPHRGAPKALEWLVNGAPWWTGARYSVRSLLRTWPSMYELMPRYRSIQVQAPSLSDDEEDGLDYPRHLPLDWLTRPAADAFALHLDIEREWSDRHASTGCVALVGRGHKTLGQAIWDGSTLFTTKKQPLAGTHGDGTVPEFSAIPIEQAAYLTHSYLAASHTGVLTASETLVVLDSLLRDVTPDSSQLRGKPPAMIGLDLEDAYEAHQSIDIAAQFDPFDGEPAGVTLSYQVTGATGDPVHSGRLRRTDGWTAQLPALDVGYYELRVQAEPAGAYPRLVTSEWFAVLDETPEALAVDATGWVTPTTTPAPTVRASERLLTPDELRELALGIRARTIPADEALAARIEAEVAAYRTHEAHPRPMLPPAALAERLPLLGWVIYDFTYIKMSAVKPAYETLPEQERASSEAADALITRVADAGRQLPWPEFAPRALGAIRSQALVASKRDTVRGYVLAWELHAEARAKCAMFAECHIGHEGRDRYLLALDEVLVQLALSETGTACRTAEQVIGRWAEGLDPTWRQDEDPAWGLLMFRELHRGVLFGKEAIGLAERIDAQHSLVHDVDEHRLVQVTAYRNPGIMTARAALLMLSFCQHMEELGRRPLGDHASWDEQRKALLDDFRWAYGKTENEVLDQTGVPIDLVRDHARSMVQLRLHLALLRPGDRLASKLAFHPSMTRELLDDEAIESLSACLADGSDDANVIGSATMPSFIRSVEASRAAVGVLDGYRQWRERWPNLDRYAGNAGRAAVVHEVLRTVTRPAVAIPAQRSADAAPAPDTSVRSGEAGGRPGLVTRLLRWLGMR